MKKRKDIKNVFTEYIEILMDEINYLTKVNIVLFLFLLLSVIINIVLIIRR